MISWKLIPWITAISKFVKYTPLENNLLYGNVVCGCQWLWLCVLQFGNTALMVASWNGHLTVVQTLLDAGADVGAQDNVSGSTLYVATITFVCSQYFVVADMYMYMYVTLLLLFLYVVSYTWCQFCTILFLCLLQIQYVVFKS